MTTIMRAVALGAALSRFRLAAFGPAISDQAGEDHHPVPGRRRDRPRRAADRAEAVGEARPAVLHREHRRRRRQPRHGAGRARAGRRLHRPAVVLEHHGQPEPLHQDAVRRGEGPDPGHQGRRLAELLAGQSELPGQDDEGAGRPDQEGARQVQRRLARRRHHAVAVDRAAQARPQGRLRHRAVRRRRADDAIAARRPRADRPAARSAIRWR